MQKYSGSATSFAPLVAAISISRAASFKLAGTLGPAVIWMAATQISQPDVFLELNGASVESLDIILN
jgi:hypothetical protein